MISIEQTVDIPASHRLTIEVPPEVPEGRAVLTLVSAETAKARDGEALKARIFAPFPTIEELKAEAARKAAEREAYFEATGNDPFQKHCGSLKGFFGEDAVAYQRRLRDEWAD